MVELGHSLCFKYAIKINVLRLGSPKYMFRVACIAVFVTPARSQTLQEQPW